MRILVLTLFALLTACTASRKTTDNDNWCASKCDAAGDEHQNTSEIFECMKSDSIMDAVMNEPELKFPLRFGIVTSDPAINKIDELVIQKAIENLNQAFRETSLAFYLDQIDYIPSGLKIEDLSRNAYEAYEQFSKLHDKPDRISVFIFEHRGDFCEISPSSISCARTGGFSYILSTHTKNIVLSHFDLEEPKIVAHEFGHFFGLYHTFEEAQFGKDTFNPNTCAETGDRICDTPPDPGAVFEIYVNYSTCEMKGYFNGNGQEYKPLIDNYMSYYKPCYLKEYSFTPGQILVLRVSGHSTLRKPFSRQE